MMLSGLAPNGNELEPPAEETKAEIVTLLDSLLTRRASSDLDQIAEPTAADLAAIDELDDLDGIADLDGTALDEPLAAPDLNPALSLLAGLAEMEEPELVSLESLDDAEDLDELDGDSDEIEESLDETDSSIADSYLELDLADEELEDEGYDLDEDDYNSYCDLYGEDDAIIPSFREGEFAEEDDDDTAYYDELR